MPFLRKHDGKKATLIYLSSVLQFKFGLVDKFQNKTPKKIKFSWTIYQIQFNLNHIPHPQYFHTKEYKIQALLHHCRKKLFPTIFLS